MKTGIGVVGGIAALFVLLFAGSTPARAAPAEAPQPARPPQPSQRDIQNAERLHQGVLEVRRLERRGRRAEAIQRAEELLAEFPGNRRIEDMLLNLYRLERRDGPLIALLQRRVERDPDDLASARELGTYLLARRRQTEALEALQKVIRAKPRDENRYRLVAVLFRSHRLLDVAVDIYRQGRRAIGREDLFAAELAQLEESRGNVGAAIGEYLLLVMDPDRRARARRKIVRLLERTERPQDVLAQVRTLRRRHPKSAPVQDVAATVYLQTGHYDDAWDAVRRADRYAGDQGEHLLEFGRLALDTAARTTTPAAEADAAPIDLERAQVGVKALEALPKRHPDSNLLPEASRLLAEGLVRLARQVPEKDRKTHNELLQRAVGSLDRALEQDAPKTLQRDALALKGMIQFEDLGDNAAALETFTRLAEQQRAIGEPAELADVQRGLVLVAMGRMDEARQVLESVAAGDSLNADEPPPGMPPGHPSLPKRRPPTPEAIAQARARFHLADLDLIQGNYDAARDGFAALAERAPDDRLANDCLDLALLLNEASMDAPAALRHFGAYRKALLERNRDTARLELEALVKDAPESSLHPQAQFELGHLLEEDGKYEVAIGMYEKLVTDHKDHRLAPRALEAIGDVYLDKLGNAEKALASYERILLEYPDDLFLDGVRRKLVRARRTLEGDPDATP